MDTRERGNVTESKIITRLLEEGFSVYTPFDDGNRVDLVVEVSGDLLRVQAKTAWEIAEGKKVKFNTESTNTYYNESKSKQYDADEIDCFIVYVPEKDDYLWIDVKEAPNTSMEVRYKEPETMMPSVNWYEDYLLNRKL